MDPLAELHFEEKHCGVHDVSRIDAGASSVEQESAGGLIQLDDAVADHAASFCAAKDCSPNRQSMLRPGNEASIIPSMSWWGGNSESHSSLYEAKELLPEHRC